MTNQNTWEGNNKHRPHTTFLILWKMRPSYTKPVQTFFIIFWSSYYNCQIELPRHTGGSLIIVHYSERAWYLLLQEYVKGDELHKNHNWPTIDPVNRQVRQYKVVHWCIICGANGNEEPHWWFHEHGNRRCLCKTQLKKWTPRVQLGLIFSEWTMS